MYINDDADMEVVVKATVDALNECSRHIGKADRHIENGQIQEIELAIIQLQQVVDRKKS